MNEPLSFLTAWLLGFIGSVHCMGMCGGIVGALSLNNQSSHPVVTHLGYHFGRISTYAILGLIAGLAGLWLAELNNTLALTLRILSGVMLILMGLYVAGLTQMLVWLEKGGARLWRKVQPLSKGLIPVSSFSQAVRLGLIWGLLPCGLVYSTLTWALVSADPFQSAGLMAAFGLGNLPALLSFGLFAQQISLLKRNVVMRHTLGILILLFGVWTIVTPVVHFAS